jgi:hypothetical protein
MQGRSSVLIWGPRGSGLHPLVQLAVNPIRHGNRSDVTAHSAQIHDCPVPLALLQVINSQLGRLVTPQSTSKPEGEQRTVAFSLHPFLVWSLPECVSLFGRQPVAYPITKHRGVWNKVTLAKCRFTGTLWSELRLGRCSDPISEKWRVIRPPATRLAVTSPTCGD